MHDSNRKTSPLNRGQAATAFGLGALITFLLCIEYINPLAEFFNQPLMSAPLAFEGKCTRIIDGDTILVTSQRGPFIVNLDSVAAPDEWEKHYAQAVQFTTRILLNKDVTVQPTRGVVPGEVDAWVYDGPQCFNNELVKAGYAQYAHDDLRDAPLRLLQDEAREAKRGLWSDPTFKAHEQCCP